MSNSAVGRKNLGDYMVEKGYASKIEIEEGLKVQATTRGDLAKILVDLGLNPKHVYEAKAQELGVLFVDLSIYKPDPSAVNVVPEHVAKRHNVLPIRKDGQILYVAMGDPGNIQASDDIRLVSRCTVRGVLAVPEEIEDAIGRIYGGITVDSIAGATPSKGGLHPLGEGGDSDIVNAEAHSGMRDAMAQYAGRDSNDNDEAAVEGADDAPIVRLANNVIEFAIKERTSEIHIEPDHRGVRVRYRIDGVLHETMTMPNYIKMPLTARYKIMAEMNIAERRLPQDGRIGIRYDGKDYDLRVSCLPNLHGEKVVMRILDKSSVMIGLNKLGFTPEMQGQLEELSQQPNGMLLSTGPTGSGKTTTQYSLLNKLNSIEKNILTIEDPCEYQLSGITQVQVNKKEGLTFVNGLPALLNHAPDVLLISDLPDYDTVRLAIKATHGGALVLSSLPCDTAPNALIYLSNMGIETFLISSTIIGILAQHLGRKICTNCKEAYEVPAKHLQQFGFKPDDLEQKVQLWRGRGCEMCRHTGYKGRIGFYELLRMNPEIADLVVRRSPLNALKEAAKANGMRELRADGLIKVLQGMTTPEEVMRVLAMGPYIIDSPLAPNARTSNVETAIVSTGHMTDDHANTAFTPNENETESTVPATGIANKTRLTTQNGLRFINTWFESEEPIIQLQVGQWYVFKYSIGRNRVFIATSEETQPKNQTDLVLQLFSEDFQLSRRQDEFRLFGTEQSEVFVTEVKPLHAGTCRLDIVVCFASELDVLQHIYVESTATNKYI